MKKYHLAVLSLCFLFGAGGIHAARGEDETTDVIPDTAAAPVAPEAESVSDLQENADLGDVAGKFTGTYFGIFYGPSIEKPTRYQPTEDGVRDPNRPVMLKNFVGLGYNITDHIRVTPTAYWLWMPSGGGAYSIQDPFLRVSDDSIFATDEFNLYGDVRYHAPVSNFSKSADINGSFQSVQVATFVPQGSRWLMGLYGSERYYSYGKKGFGNDFELYIGPNVGYQLDPKLQLTMLYETNLVHQYGTNPSTMDGDGTDLQTGVSWDVSPNVNFHPYVSVYPGNLALKTTSLGALVYLQAF